MSLAGFGLLVKTLTIPAGNDNIMSPLSFTWHRVSSLPLKYEWMISWNATASGIVSAKPMVRGDGPRDDPTATPAARNSRLATLSARDIVAGDILPRTSPLRDGGLGMAIEPVGVEDADCFGGKAGVMSPISENKSPSVKCV